MLFPPVEDYIRWMEAAGFEDVRVRELAPDWYRDRRVPYALAVSGVKRVAGAVAGARSRSRRRHRQDRCGSRRGSCSARRRARCSCRSRPRWRCARAAKGASA